MKFRIICQNLAFKTAHHRNSMIKVMKHNSCRWRSCSLRESDQQESHPKIKELNMRYQQKLLVLLTQN